MKPPVLLFVSEYDAPTEWREAIAAADPGIEFRAYPEMGDPGEIDAALVWAPPAQVMAACTNLKMVSILGAGADAAIGATWLPEGVPVCRIVDDGMQRMMVAYVVHAVLAIHRDASRTMKARRERRWDYVHPRDTAERRVGVMGLGNLGGAAAKAIAMLGFPVSGWSRSPKAIPGIACFSGMDSLATFLEGCDVLVVLLPLTPETRGILDAAALAHLPEGAFVVNAGRGALLDEAALEAEIRSGRIAGATLDVFQEEPLPEGHPFWDLEEVMITPHHASVPNPMTAAPQVAANVRRAVAGEPLLNVIDPSRGY